MKKDKPVYEKAILSAKKQFIAIAGKEAWSRESGFALSKIGISEISSCDPESIKQAVMNIAYTGTSLNPIYQESYLIARDGRCFLDFTYKGLIKIATSEGAIVSLSAGAVYTWDQISHQQGTNAFLDVIQSMDPPHDPDDIARNPKMIWEHLKCAYSIATFPNGAKDFILLPKFKLLKTWNNTEKSAINLAWPEEWIRKTAIKYHSKTLPRAQRLVTAVAVLNEHEGVSKKKKKPESRLMGRMKK